MIFLHLFLASTRAGTEMVNDFITSRQAFIFGAFEHIRNKMALVLSAQWTEIIINKVQFMWKKETQPSILPFCRSQSLSCSFLLSLLPSSRSSLLGKSAIHHCHEFFKFLTPRTLSLSLELSTCRSPQTASPLKTQSSLYPVEESSSAEVLGGNKSFRADWDQQLEDHKID